MDFKQELRTFIRDKIIKDDDITFGDDDALITAGMIDSFDLVKVMVFAEQKLGIKVDNSKLTVKTMNTLNDMVRTIDSAKK
jgi:acyl carrier protein